MAEVDGQGLRGAGSGLTVWPGPREEENAQSRIYLGIHFAFDKTAGIAQGRQIADLVYRDMFQPVAK